MKKSVVLILMFSAIAGAATYEYSVDMKDSEGRVHHVGDIRINVIEDNEDTESASTLEQEKQEVQLVNDIREQIKKYYYGYNINTILMQGSVILEGVVNAEQDKMDIEKNIGSLKGVNKVENKLKTRKEKE